MPTAKKYMGFEHHAPYRVNGKMYVDVEIKREDCDNTYDVKRVRWYTDAEWMRLYPNEVLPKEATNFRSILGFGEAGYITVYLGETYPHLSWFKEHQACRYNKIFGWFTPSNEEVTDELPYGVETAEVRWDDVCTPEGEVDEDKARKVMEALKYADVDPGDFVGEIGERLEFKLTIDKTIPFDNMYGASTMHVMTDEDGNTFIWTTGSKTLEVGKTYTMRGTIKDHRTYRGINQTVLSRCMSIKEVE